MTFPSVPIWPRLGTLGAAGTHYRRVQLVVESRAHRITMEPPHTPGIRSREISRISNPLNERTTMSYDPLDCEQHRVLANGGTISHTWDAAGRETLIENRNAAGVGQFIATNTYSQVDNRLTVLELDGIQATFAYGVEPPNLQAKPEAEQWLIIPATCMILIVTDTNSTIQEF